MSLEIKENNVLNKVLKAVIYYTLEQILQWRRKISSDSGENAREKVILSRAERKSCQNQIISITRTRGRYTSYKTQNEINFKKSVKENEEKKKISRIINRPIQMRTAYGGDPYPPPPPPRIYLIR